MSHTESEVKPATQPPPKSRPEQTPTPDEGPAPIGTVFIVAVLVIFIIGFWMLILGIQQGRA